jgi:glycosyltransferase involved in cell wall biosynthesis
MWGMEAAATGLPRVSVALCAFNGERWLAEQLDSVLAQDGVEVDVVAMDDASTDGTFAILQAYAAKDPRVRVYRHEENLGHLRSFEQCMDLCEAPLIAPCDQDDVWEPTKLATLAAAIGEADLAYCDSLYVDADGRSLGRRLSGDRTVMHAGRDPLRFAFENTVSGHALLVRKSVVERAHPFPVGFFHDWWLAMQAAGGAGVVYVDKPLVRFRRHASASSSMGKDAKGDERTVRKPRSRNKRWVEQLLAVFDALGTIEGMSQSTALMWHSALREAMAGRSWPLWRIAWRTRRSLPPWRGPRWFAAVACWARCVRKIRAARREKGAAAAFRVKR